MFIVEEERKSQEVIEESKSWAEIACDSKNVPLQENN
jgi:hypothetical protein